jgi:hypothetical protein
MSSSSSSSSSASISTSGLLGVLFVGLKLTGFINWPWVWVLAPFWIPVVIVLGILLLGGIAVLTCYLINSLK